MAPRRLATGQQCRVLTYDVATGTSTLVHAGTSVLFEAPNWTADDALILNGDGLLWRLPADGTAAPRQIPLDGIPELNNDHVLAPDHQTIYLSADDGHIYQAPVRGGSGRRVTSGDTRLHFLHGVSPDGSTLAYVGIDQPDWATASLWTIGVDGSGDTRLTAAGGIDDGPEYTPDGAWIYWNTERFSADPGHAQIARMRPDGTGLEQLTADDRVNWFPHIAPDGRHAVYLSYPPGTQGHPADLPVELRLVRADAWHAPQTVVELDGGQGTINVNSWSPDSRRFAYVAYPMS
ncbi:TolB family protein [Dactylosporangium sp. CA-139066]|uniref:TolB family protein n=1 Tax=Dactylosporangium sp. CA-139066 TaxID=3239930 RepID=UPI003D948D7D